MSSIDNCMKNYTSDKNFDTVNEVSVVLIVSADTCMQVVQGSNPTDDYKIHSIFLHSGI